MLGLWETPRPRVVLGGIICQGLASWEPVGDGLRDGCTAVMRQPGL